jgi:hypothetical protein
MCGSGAGWPLVRGLEGSWRAAGTPARIGYPSGELRAVVGRSESVATWVTTETSLFYSVFIPVVSVVM